MGKRERDRGKLFFFFLSFFRAPAFLFFLFFVLHHLNFYQQLCPSAFPAPTTTPRASVPPPIALVLSFVCVSLVKREGWPSSLAFVKKKKKK